MSWDLMYDVEEFKLISVGWHIVEVTSAIIKPQDKAKRPDSKNDKNFVVEMTVKEGSEDDGATVTRYFANVAPRDMGLKQLGALMDAAGMTAGGKPIKELMTGPEFFASKAFETNFQMKLPGRTLGVKVGHRPGSQKTQDGKIVMFADVTNYRTVKDAQKEMKGKPKAAVAGASQDQTKEAAPGVVAAPPEEEWE